MSIERKYQVFVSSTYTDLKLEREKVQQALLVCDCIPIGMETFPPANESQWGYIQRMIAQCDFYLVILAGRYGSIDETSGLSYTEKEYRHAIGIGIPVLGFYFSDPSKLPVEVREHDARVQKKLDAFRKLVLSKLSRDFSDPHELYGRVIHAITEQKKSYPEGGWVPAKYLPKVEVQGELDSLRAENEALRKQLEEVKAGKYTAQCIDSKPNHLAARDGIESYIRESLRMSDSVNIRVMAVSLHYSWDFLEHQLPTILDDTPGHKKISLELEMIDPEHLGQLGLRDWQDKGKHIQERIKTFVDEERKPGRMIDIGRLEISLYRYNNIPHWHGILINSQYLILGRTRWVFNPDRSTKRLTVGEELYRFFAYNDSYGGGDRIQMFECWFDYYRHSGVPVVEAFRGE